VGGTEGRLSNPPAFSCGFSHITEAFLPSTPFEHFPLNNSPSNPKILFPQTRSHSPPFGNHQLHMLAGGLGGGGLQRAPGRQVGAQTPHEDLCIIHPYTVTRLHNYAFGDVSEEPGAKKTGHPCVPATLALALALALAPTSSHPISSLGNGPD